MKNSKQKLISLIVLSLFFLTGVSNSAFSQTEVVPKLSGFLILIETTNNEIKLTCQDGSAWKELKFTLKSGNMKAIDQNGMTTLDENKTKNESNPANFLFTIKKTKDGLSLEGIKGTSWKNLSFSCPESKCYKKINQNGISE